jgi:DNA-binding winged helix-turn-helix (wHTH) protein
MSLRFAGCVLDVEARRLLRGRTELRLSPKAFETLRVLVESRPRALTKTELLDRVWPGVFVSDASVAKAVSEIREGLRDRHSRVIRTVHGYGYAFAADVEEAPSQGMQDDTAPCVCWLVSGTRALSLHPGEQILGRGPKADLLLDSPKISRRHARIIVDDTYTTIEDLGSKNGTFVRGGRISAPTVLQDGDTIRLGRHTFTFRMEKTAPSTETARLSGSGASAL